MRRAVSDGDAKKRRGEGLEQPKSSAPTEVEPNGSLAQATPTTLDEELRGVLGSISGSGDVDWLAVSPSRPEGESLEIRVEPKNASLDLVVLLSMGEGTEPLVYDIAGAGAPEIVPAAWFGTRGLSIGVRAKAGSGDYAVRWKRQLSSSPVENEPNDSVAAATELSAPGALSGVCDRPGDVDLIKIVSSTPGAMALEVTAPRDRAMTARVGADPSAPIATLSVEPGKTASAPALAVGEGALLEIRCAGDLFSREYGWRISLSAPPDMPEGVMGEIEPNDAIAQAQPIPADVRVLGYWSSPEDEDRYAFVVPEPGPAPITPTPAPPAKAPEVTAPAKVTPAGAAPADAGSTPPKATGPEGMPPRELVGDLIPEDRDEVVRAVLGDDAESAKAPAPTPPRVITPTFAFVDKPRRPSFAATLTPRLKDARVVLSWERAEEKGGTVRSYGPGQPVELCVGSATPGTYVFSARAEGQLERGEHQGPDYELVVEDRAAGRGGEVEPNEDARRADPFDSEGKVTGTIATARDVDVFAFVVSAPQGERKNVTLTIGAHPNAPQVLLRDEDGIGAGRVVTGPSGRAYTGELIAGVYFVEVRAERGSCAPYELTVDIR